MSDIKLSKHAKVRQQQRCIPQLIINWLVDYGVAEYDKRGAKVHYFAKESIRRMRSEFGSLVIDKLSDFMRAYLVLSVDGQIITVGYRH